MGGQTKNQNLRNLTQFSSMKPRPSTVEKVSHFDDSSLGKLRTNNNLRKIKGVGRGADASGPKPKLGKTEMMLRWKL